MPWGDHTGTFSFHREAAMLTGQFHSTKMRMICILPWDLDKAVRNLVDDADIDLAQGIYMRTYLLHGAHIG